MAPTEQAAQTSPPEPNQTASQAAANPVSAEVGSVAGVDLNEFGSQANQGAAVVSQDGTADAQSISANGASINSSIDSVNNPIQ